ELPLQAVAEGLVVGFESAGGGRDFGNAVLGQPRGLAERLRRVRGEGQAGRVGGALVGGGGGRGLSVRLPGTPLFVGQAASAGGDRAQYTVRVAGLRRRNDAAEVSRGRRDPPGASRGRAA